MADFSELGVSGLERNNGVPDDEFIKQLTGQNLFRVIREMAENDSIVGGMLFAINQSMRRAEWEAIVPDELVGDSEAEAYRQFVEECQHDMSASWDDTLSETQTMLPYGWAAQEIVLKRRGGGGENDPAEMRSKYEDNRIGWRKLPLRAQATRKEWVFDENGGIEALVQTDPNDFRDVEIPIKKLLLFRTSTALGNPEGKSILRTAWRDWYWKTRIQEVEGIGIERDLAGLPKADVPWRLLSDSATQDEKQVLHEIKRILRNVRRDDMEGVLWPQQFDGDGNKLYELSLMSSGGARQFDTSEIITRYEQRMAMTVLADFILLGHAKVGTQALSVSKIDLFTSALKAWLDAIASVFNRFAIPRLLRVNGFNEKKAPLLQASKVEHTDLRELADFLATGADAGIVLPDRGLEEFFRGMIPGVPPPPEEDLEPTDDRRTAKPGDPGPDQPEPTGQAGDANMPEDE